MHSMSCFECLKLLRTIFYTEESMKRNTENLLLCPQDNLSSEADDDRELESSLSVF